MRKIRCHQLPPPTPNSFLRCSRGVWQRRYRGVVESGSSSGEIYGFRAETTAKEATRHGHRWQAPQSVGRECVLCVCVLMPLCVCVWVCVCVCLRRIPAKEATKHGHRWQAPQSVGRSVSGRARACVCVCVFVCLCVFVIHPWSSIAIVCGCQLTLPKQS